MAMQLVRTRRGRDALFNRSCHESSQEWEGWAVYLWLRHSVRHTIWLDKSYKIHAFKKRVHMHAVRSNIQLFAVLRVSFESSSWRVSNASIVLRRMRDWRKKKSIKPVKLQNVIHIRKYLRRLERKKIGVKNLIVLDMAMQLM